MNPSHIVQLPLLSWFEGFIATWDVSTKGELSSNFTTSTPAAGGLLPFSMTLIPGKNALLNTDPGIGFSIFDFAKGDVASSTAYPIAKQQATCWSTYSQKTGTFFLTDAGTSTVTEVKVNNNLSALILKVRELACDGFDAERLYIPCSNMIWLPVRLR